MFPKEEINLFSGLLGKMENLLEEDSDLFIRKKHKLVLKALESSIQYYKDKDIVEFERTLISVDKMKLTWENLDIYSYDIENLFVNECVLHLKIDNAPKYILYFGKVSDTEMSLIVALAETSDIVCGGAIVVEDGKFVPYGCLNDKFYDFFIKEHTQNGLPTDIQFMSNRVLLNFFCNFMIVNDYVINHKEVVVETSKRIEIKNKKGKKKKKHQPKKTQLIRCIKIDTEKARQVNQKRKDELLEKREYERHVSQWTRRGHFRKFKNGTVKWIAPQVIKAKKTDSDKISKKIYKIQ